MTKEQTPEQKIELANTMLDLRTRERIKLEQRFKYRLQRIMQECEAALRTFPLNYGGISSPISANDASELHAMVAEHRGLKEQISLLDYIADREAKVDVCNCITEEHCPLCTPPDVLEEERAKAECPKSPRGIHDMVEVDPSGRNPGRIECKHCGRSEHPGLKEG